MYGFRGFGAFAPPTGNIATVLQNASSSSGVPLPILQALAFLESSYNPAAVSSKGAQGLLQIMPANDAAFGLTDPLDPQQNANAGAKYLAQLYQQYGNWNDALIAYNEGPGNFSTQGPFASSQTYASTILSNAGYPAGSSDSSDSTAAAAPADSSSTDISASDMLSSLGDSITSGDPLVLAGLALAGFGLLYLMS